jgi:hypothetical protein
MKRTFSWTAAIIGALLSFCGRRSRNDRGCPRDPIATSSQKFVRDAVIYKWSSTPLALAAASGTCRLKK